MVDVLKSWYSRMRGVVVGSVQGARAGYAVASEEPGVPWPPIADRPRLARYERYRQIYESEHHAVYIDSGEYEPPRKARPYLCNNILGDITDLIVDRLFGEGLRMEVAWAEAEREAGVTWLTQLATDSALSLLWPEIGISGSYRGDAVLRVSYDAGRRQVMIDAVSPEMYYPTHDSRGRLLMATLAWVDEEPGGEAGTLWQETYGPGYITEIAHRVRRARDGSWRYDPAADVIDISMDDDPDSGPGRMTETGIEGILLVPIAVNQHDRAGVWGRSDYQRIDALQGELNNRMTQSGDVLDRHADPWMFGDAGLLDPRTGKLRTREKFLIMERAEQPPGYLSWDPRLEASQWEITQLERQIAMRAGISPESLVASETGGAEAGRALKLRQFRTAGTVTRRQLSYGPAIQQAISLASKLALSPVTAPASKPPRAIQPTEVRLSWGDGLPDDEYERTQVETLAIDGGMSSARSARMRLYGMTPEEADAEQEQIDRERQATRVAAPAGMSISSRLQGITPASNVSDASRETETELQQGAGTASPKGNGG
jgi:hypothetical protein